MYSQLLLCLDAMVLNIQILGIVAMSSLLQNNRNIYLADKTIGNGWDWKDSVFCYRLPFACFLVCLFVFNLFICLPISTGTQR